MFKLSKNKAEMAVLSLLGLSMVGSPYAPISAPPFKKIQPLPTLPKESLNFQDKLSLEMSYIKLWF